MKWELPQKSRLGQFRWVEKFAWLPTECVGNYNDYGNWTRYRVWFEHYIQTQEFKRVMVEEYGHGYYKEQWVKTGNTIISKELKEKK
jgi:hypothetical protein